MGIVTTIFDKISAKDDGAYSLSDTESLPCYDPGYLHKDVTAAAGAGIHAEHVPDLERFRAYNQLGATSIIAAYETDNHAARQCLLDEAARMFTEAEISAPLAP